MLKNANFNAEQYRVTREGKRLKKKEKAEAEATKKMGKTGS